MGVKGRTWTLNLDAFYELADEWTEEAELLRRRGQESLARMAESYAEDLRARAHAWAVEPLTVTQAAEESEYSESTLYGLLSDGKLPNVGKAGAPRIPRHALPRKPTRPTGPRGDTPMTIAERALEART